MQASDNLTQESLMKCIEEIVVYLSFNKDNAAKILLQQVLTKAKLDTKQISGQALPQLDKSLENINIIIDKLEGLRSSKNPFEAMAAIQYLPTLLERKKFIVDHIHNTHSEQEIVSIVSRATDSSSVELKREIEELLERNAENAKESMQIEVKKDKFSEELLRMKEEREAFKERWTIRRSFLEKEPVSTLVGALLLIIMVIVLTMAAFLKITIPQVLNDGFLIILGYFFGQKVFSGSSNKNKD